MLKNKVVVITGGAGLLGQEFAKAVLKNNGQQLLQIWIQNMDLKLPPIERTIPGRYNRFSTIEYQ